MQKNNFYLTKLLKLFKSRSYLLKFLSENMRTKEKTFKEKIQNYQKVDHDQDLILKKSIMKLKNLFKE